MTFLIIALSCHYFENGIKQESCMYDQYFLAAGMPDQCYLLELPLLIFQFSKFSFLLDLTGGGRARVTFRATQYF